MFQDIGGEVLLVDDEVWHKHGRVVAPGDDVLTLVDADGKFCIPNSHFLDTANLRATSVTAEGQKGSKVAHSIC